ncbi:hypothetical protein GUITHDRAFT_102537 [Guillardia theta CCMP2712]|uniref:LCCL domain-containing protein n=1 Tax=Guillardia theta (strain CCMP2712) TaxID=905079 RepID=L1JU34_GUITC|nr:hypothetical protein GUITHDRAFT_102537 [Guillardia theta CCMP2712]EKX51927.1 hypothetical protein GUITHDRAFT_102537 [Guillardia theta CCMP2712]|eukprot:XP_005838907.1 hypothetical protein GUITHDRAFT_102537 [Guillardia theta CCMP2712]
MKLKLSVESHPWYIKLEGKRKFLASFWWAIPLWTVVYLVITCVMLTFHMSPSPISCGSWIWSLWCGDNGELCTSTLPWGWSEGRCASNCAKPDVNQVYAYRLYGSGPYAGNSFICAAARHAGLIGADGGGIRFRLDKTPEGLTKFDGGTQNGVVAQPLGYFPAVLVVEKAEVSYHHSIRWVFFSIQFLMLSFFLLLEPCNDFFFFMVFLGAYTYTQFVTLSLNASPEAIVVTASKTIWTSFFFLGLPYVILFRKQDKGPWARDAVVLRWICVLAPVFFMQHLDDLLSVVPNITLGSTEWGNASFSDAGAVALLVIGFLVLLVLLINAIWCYLRAEDITRTEKVSVVSFYAAFGVIFGICISYLKGSYGPHFHHLYAAILIWPLCRKPTAMVTFLFSIAAGMFLEGYLFWGLAPWFDNIGSAGVRTPLPDIVVGSQNITFKAPRSFDAGFPYLAVYINDVQRLTMPVHPMVPDSALEVTIWNLTTSSSNVLQLYFMGPGRFSIPSYRYTFVTL